MCSTERVNDKVPTGHAVVRVGQHGRWPVLHSPASDHQLIEMQCVCAEMQW
jgi:hypothetical protein